MKEGQVKERKRKGVPERKREIWGGGGGEGADDETSVGCLDCGIKIQY